MDIREIDPHDETLVRQHWEIGKIADSERPHDFYPSWGSAWLTVSRGRDDVEMVLLGAFDGEAMWGAARIDLPRYDNLHAARAVLHVHPGRRRRGIGAALAQESCEVARGRGRRVIMSEAYAPLDRPSPGLLFGAAMGFDTVLEEGMKVVDLVDTEPTWAALAAEVAPRHRDYRIVTWSDRLPDAYVDGACRLNEMFFEEAPTGGLQVERESWTEARVRSREQRNAGQRRHDLAAGALDAAGNLVALTEIGVSDFASHRGFQSGTLVAPEHRGHALGLAIKLANHRQVRELFPQCRMLITGNAGVNAPMNAVNERLGYREVERCIELQRDL